MGYRWNLDYVVDPHGNLTTYDYATETNYYERGGGQGTGTRHPYVRGGYPTSISYGYLLSDAIAGAQPAAQVVFGTSQRCLTSSTFTELRLRQPQFRHGVELAGRAVRPELRLDRHLHDRSPTFWSTVRLTSITTQVLEGSWYQQADTYALTQSFPMQAGAPSRA